MAINMYSLTKPQTILYLIQFDQYRTLDDFFATKLFKDKKAVSNALYQLHKNGYVVKSYNGQWYMTPAGEAYLIETIQNASSQKEPASKTNDEIQALYNKIAELDAENKKLVDNIAYWKDRYLVIAKKHDELRSICDDLANKVETAQVDAFASIGKICSDIAAKYRK